MTVTTAAATSRFIYVSSIPDNKIGIFSVNDSTGLLTSVGTASSGANSGPAFLAMHPSGKFVYSVNTETNDITLFRLNTTTGMPSATVTGVSACAGPVFLMFTADGKFAYMTCEAASAVVAYSVDASTGNLTAVSGSPFSIGGGRVRGLAISPDNKFLYVADRDATPNGIAGYIINGTTGALSKITGSPFLVNS